MSLSMAQYVLAAVLAIGLSLGAVGAAHAQAAASDPAAERPVAAAVSDLTTRTGVPPESVSVVELVAVEWSTSALGCPQPGRYYLQVITPGYRISLAAAGQLFDYRTNQGTVVVLCGRTPLATAETGEAATADADVAAGGEAAAADSAGAESGDASTAEADVAAGGEAAASEWAAAAAAG